MHIVVMTDVATALIRRICKMQLSFRLDKRPGESHLALDGKKHCCFFCSCLVHSLAVWVTLALQNMPPKARAPEAPMVGSGFGVEFCTCSGPSRCLSTVCIPSCWIFSPDQGRATAAISSRFGCMELSSPMLQCCHFQHRGLGRRAPAQLESQDTHPIARLNYATICNSAAWSTNLMTLLLDDFFDESLSYMLAVWARGAVLSWDGTAQSN